MRRLRGAMLDLIFEGRTSVGVVIRLRNGDVISLTDRLWNDEERHAEDRAMGLVPITSPAAWYLYATETDLPELAASRGRDEIYVRRGACWIDAERRDLRDLANEMTRIERAAVTPLPAARFRLQPKGFLQAERLFFLTGTGPSVAIPSYWLDNRYRDLVASFGDDAPRTAQQWIDRLDRDEDPALVADMGGRSVYRMDRTFWLVDADLEMNEVGAAIWACLA